MDLKLGTENLRATGKMGKEAAALTFTFLVEILKITLGPYSYSPIYSNIFIEHLTGSREWKRYRHCPPRGTQTGREKRVCPTVRVSGMTPSRRAECTERRLEHDDTDVNDRKINTARARC